MYVSAGSPDISDRFDTDQSWCQQEKKLVETRFSGRAVIIFYLYLVVFHVSYLSVLT
jgi:hypothetical protein